MNKDNKPDDFEDLSQHDNSQPIIKADPEERASTDLPNAKQSTRSKKLIVLIGVGVILLFVVLTLLSGRSKKETAPKEDPDKVVVKDKADFHYDEKESPPNKLFQTPVEPPKEDKPAMLLGAPETPEAPEEAPKPKLIKGTGPFRVGGNSSGNAEPDTTADDFDDGKGNDDRGYQSVFAGTSGNPGGNNQQDIFQAPVFEATVAKKSKYNPHLLLSKGTMIQCSLRTKLVTNVSGQISCVISDNVYSSSGSVVLVEKGSRVNGFYLSTSAQHGSSEIFAVWQEIRTPNNLVIPVNSGSTDELGANGLRGWADQHFWDRFENAILLSMIKDVSGALSSRASKSQGEDYGQNTRDAAQDVAEKVLDQMGDIKPTIYKNQGDKVGIFVARDVDFSKVYRLRRKGYHAIQ